MPAKHVKQIKLYATDEQVDAIRKVYTGNMSELMRQLLKQYVEANGGTWPDNIVPRGKYLRDK